MRFLKYRTTFYIGFILILAMVMGGSAIAAFASTSPVTTTVNAGRLSLSGPASVNATTVTLNDKDLFSTYTLPLTVIDARGSGAGWNLTITSTTFTSGSNKKINTLANNASNVTGLVATCNAHSTCMLPNNRIRYPVAVPAGTTPPPVVTFFNAAAHSGLGSFTIAPTISIFAPHNTDVGTYTSNVYVAFGSGQSIHIVVTLAVQRKGDDTPSASTIKYILPLSFNNPGSGNWHLSITSTQFATGGTPGYTLPTTVSSLVDMTGVCQAGQNCSNNVVGYPIVLPAGDPAPNPVIFYDGTANTEIDLLNVVAAINTIIPVNAEAGTYTSTMTVAFQSGP